MESFIKLQPRTFMENVNVLKVIYDLVKGNVIYQV